MKFFFGNFDATGRFSANLYYCEQSYVISSYIFWLSLIFLAYNLKYFWNSLLGNNHAPLVVDNIPLAFLDWHIAMEFLDGAPAVYFDRRINKVTVATFCSAFRDKTPVKENLEGFSLYLQIIETPLWKLFFIFWNLCPCKAIDTLIT